MQYLLSIINTSTIYLNIPTKFEYKGAERPDFSHSP
jgi:hypothetical protein